MLLTSNNIEKDPSEPLHKRIHPVRDIWLDDVWTNDVHHDIELESVGEEDGNAEHAQGRLSQDVPLGEIKSDGCCRVCPVFEVAEESHAYVQSSNGHHGGVQNTVPPQHVLWLGHLILNRQHHTDSLKCKNCRSKENGKLDSTCKPGHGIGAGDGCGKNIVENNAKTNKLKNVG